jgi:UDP-glucuronate decarboxylase
VSDLVEALLLVAFDGNANGRVFNLGNQQEVTMLELARLVSDVVGIDTGIEFSSAAADDPARRRPDISRMIERYGWQPFVGLAEGLRDTVAYFRDATLDRVEVASEAA